MKLATYLKRKEISPAVLARRVGCSRQTIYNYMRGTRKPSLRTAMRIVAVTRGKVSLKELLDGGAEQDEKDEIAA
jgi:DNA-binding XRE family transcriptional regulator